ncbi:hypothetical protein H7F15_15825 [Pontibacter sp. Tf4]|nr:hypothetical protein [Pontibacter sp. Tf4]MBB6612514.1 hypothetical protein [Pontibacter sp. Tf4]
MKTETKYSSIVAAIVYPGDGTQPVPQGVRESPDSLGYSYNAAPNYS